MVITGNKITDWIKYELYPAFFDRIDHALQEHQFRRARGGWESKTYLNGSPHKDQQDKTVVSTKAPGRILEQGGENIDLVEAYLVGKNISSYLPESYGNEDSLALSKENIKMK